MKIFHKLLVLIIATAIGIGCNGQDSSHQYNVKDFGARGNSMAIDTDAIQRAIDAAAGDSGGTVVVPAGDYLIGSIHLKDNIHLKLKAGATLIGSEQMADYDSVNMRGKDFEATTHPNTTTKFYWDPINRK